MKMEKGGKENMSLEEKNVEARKRIIKAVEKTEEKEAVDLAAQLSVRDRLMRRLQTKTFKTVLEDDLGEFTIETRLMTSGERFRALQYNKAMAEAGNDLEKYAKAIAGFKRLCSEIVVTPGLEGFWEGDDVSDDVVIAVVLNALYGSITAAGDSIGSFRKE